MSTHFLLIASFADSVLRFRGALIEDLTSQNMVIHVAVPGLANNPSIRKELEAVGAEVHEISLSRTGTNPLSDLSLLWRLYRLMRRIRPDVVLAYTIKPVIYGLIAAWLAGVPRRFALVTGLGYTFMGERTGLLGRFVQQLYRLALGNANKVFFQNPDDEATFRSRRILIDNTPSVVVNGSGIDTIEFGVSPIPIAYPRFLMIARLLSAKGVHEYASAARRVRQSNPEVRFRLVGWIDENPDAIRQTELDAWVREGDIEFLGHLQDVRPAIADSTVYVLPSSYPEGTPRTVLEAMAMGRAIITTDTPGCRETVTNGENGFLVSTKSVSDLVDAMRRFIDDPDLAKRMGHRSREIAVERYDVHKVNAVMLREMGIT